MRKLVLILIAFIAVLTFIRALDYSDDINSDSVNARRIPGISENISDLELN